MKSCAEKKKAINQVVTLILDMSVMWIIIMWHIDSKFAGDVLIGLRFKKSWPLLKESAISNVDAEKKKMIPYNFALQF